MRHKVERIRFRGWARVVLALVTTAVFVVGSWLSLYLALNSRHGAAVLNGVLAGVLAGEVEFEQLRVGRDLLSVQLHHAVLRDPTGRPVIEADTIGTRFEPRGLLRDRIELVDFFARNGQVTIVEYADDDISIVKAIRGDFDGKRHPRHPRVVSFQNMNLLNMDVVVQMDDMLLRFDDVNVREGVIESGRGRMLMRADLEIAGGRLMLSERLFSLGDGKSSWAMAAWEAARRGDPWAVSRAPAPEPAEGRRGVLDLAIGRGSLSNFTWFDNAFTFDRFALEGPDVGMQASGWLRLIPERPKLARTERGGVYWDGAMSLMLPPESKIFDYFVPGIVSDNPDPDGAAAFIEPIRFDGYGNVRFVEGRARLAFERLGILGWPIRSFEAELGWDDGELRLFDGAAMQVFGGRVTGSGRMTPRQGLWNLDLCVDSVRMRRVLRPFTDDANDSFVDHLLDFTITTTPARCENGEAAAIALRGDLTRKAFELAPAATTPNDATVQAPMLAGAVDNLILSWDRSDPGFPVDQLRLDVHAALSQRGIVSFFDDDGSPGLRVRSPLDEFSLAGTYDIVSDTLGPTELGWESQALSAWLTAFGASGLPVGLGGSLRVAVSGPASAPTVGGFDVALALDTPSAPFPAFTATAAGDIAGDVVHIRDFAVDSTLGHAAGAADLDVFDGSILAFAPTPRITADVEIDNFAVGVVVPIVGSEATLDTALAVDWSPGGLQVDGHDLSIDNFKPMGESLDSLTVGRFSASDSAIAVHDVMARRARSTIAGHFVWDFGTDVVDAAVEARDVRLRDIDTFSAAGVDIRGLLDVDASIRGPLSAPDVEGSVVVERLRLFRYPVGGVALAFDTEGDQVHVAGNVGGVLGVDARVPVDLGPIQIATTFQNVPLESFINELNNIGGRVELSGRIDTVLDPFGEGTATAEARLDDVQIRFGERVFSNPSPVLASWSASLVDDAVNQVVTVRQATLGIDDRFVTLRGTLELAEEPIVTLTLGGQTDFSLLRFLPSLVADAEGRVDVALKVNGPVSSPQIYGNATFGASRIVPRGLGTEVALEPGGFAIDTEALRFDPATPLRGHLFGGEFAASGEIGLRGVVPDSVDLRAFVTDLLYRIPDQLNMTLNADVRFMAGKLADYETWWVGGDIELVDARFYRNFDVVSDAVAFGSIGRSMDSYQLPIWQRVPAIGAMDTDLVITGRDEFTVESRVANMELDVEMRTDLELHGRLRAMELTGEMEVLEGGRVWYRGRAFSADRAVLAFLGERDPDGYPMPFLDAELSASITPCVRRASDTLESLNSALSPLNEITDVRITAYVDGLLPYELNFRLESTPAYDQRDLLSLILTGCTVDELTAASGAGPTLDMVLRPVIDVVERNVEERLDFDDVNLIPIAEGAAGIQIADEITERLAWTLDATVGATDGTRQVVRGEYRLFDWLLVEVQEQTNREENVRIDTGLRFRFTLD